MHASRGRGGDGVSPPLAGSGAQTTCNQISRHKADCWLGSKVEAMSARGRRALCGANAGLAWPDIHLREQRGCTREAA